MALPTESPTEQPTVALGNLAPLADVEAAAGDPIDEDAATRPTRVIPAVDGARARWMLTGVTCAVLGVGVLVIRTLARDVGRYTPPADPIVVLDQRATRPQPAPIVARPIAPRSGTPAPIVAPLAPPEAIREASRRPVLLPRVETR